jgi:hypothetical protein
MARISSRMSVRVLLAVGAGLGLAAVLAVLLRGRAQASPAEEEYRQDPVDDALVAREASAAAAAAAMIGGSVAHDVEDPAMAPVYEAGGGEQDGWEAAESELIENASHGDGGGDPLRDAITPELESDAAGAVYGEADRLRSTETDEDVGEAPGRA